MVADTLIQSIVFSIGFYCLEVKVTKSFADFLLTTPSDFVTYKKNCVVCCRHVVSIKRRYYMFDILSQIAWYNCQWWSSLYQQLQAVSRTSISPHAFSDGTVALTLVHGNIVARSTYGCSPKYTSRHGSKWRPKSEIESCTSVRKIIHINHQVTWLMIGNI